MNNKKPEHEYDFSDWTVKELREFASKNNITIPSDHKKDDIIEMLKKIVSHPDFIDRTREEELEEKLYEDQKEDPDEGEKGPLFQKESKELKFWQKPPYSSLLNLDVAKDSDIAFYDLSSLVDNFFDKMLQENFINYKVSGIALKTSASLHHHKISSVIEEQEKIQKQEEINKMRERTSRKIPETLNQPVKPKFKTSTKKELFGAMRDAIIETMQKKEKLKRRRIKKEKKKEKQKEEAKVKAELPKELLKHITGKEQTIDELLDSWYNRIKASINLNEKRATSLQELETIIKNEEESLLDRKFALVRLFLALMFLSNSNRLNLNQENEFKDIKIQIE
jgi:chromatin segregation and condensation protein Rec8/ScpA/Scc1 (kleisin family)